MTAVFSAAFFFAAQPLPAADTPTAAKLLAKKWDSPAQQQRDLLRQAGDLALAAVESAMRKNAGENFKYQDASFLTAIVADQLALGDIEGALALARKTPSQWRLVEGQPTFGVVSVKDLLLDLIAKAQLQAGDLKGATATAMDIDFEPVPGPMGKSRVAFPDKAALFTAVIKRQTDAGNFTQAFASVRQYFDLLSKRDAALPGVFPPPNYAEILQPILATMVAKGQSKEALEQARILIKNPATASEAFRLITIATAQAGRAEEAKSIAKETFQGYNAALVLSEISAIEAQIGHLNESRATAAQVEALLAALPENIRGAALRQIAVDRAAAGDHAGALAAAREAKTGQLSLGDLGGDSLLPRQTSQESLYIDMAAAEALAGKFPDALDTARQEPDPLIRADILMAIAQKQTVAYDKEAALKSLDQAWDIVLTLPNSYPKAGTMYKIVKTLIAYGSKRDLSAMLTACLDSTGDNRKSDRNNNYLSKYDVVGTQAQLGDYKTALANAATLHFSYGKHFAFEQIAIAQARAGLNADAAKTLEYILVPTQMPQGNKAVIAQVIKNGDQKTALALLPRYGKPSNGNVYYTSSVDTIVQDSIKRGDLAATEKLLEEIGAGSSLALLTGQINLARAQVQLGNHDAAQANLKKAAALLSDVPAPESKAGAAAITLLQLQIADDAGLKSLQQSLSSTGQQRQWVDSIAEKLARDNDFADLTATYGLSSDPLIQAKILWGTARGLKPTS